MNMVRINAWKVDGFMMGLKSMGFDLDKLEMKHSDNYKRFGWYYGGVLVAKYDDNKQRGYFDADAKCRCAKLPTVYVCR